MKRVLTIHVPDGKEQDSWNLTPAMVSVLSAIAVAFDKPRIVRRADGLAVYVLDWRGVV